MAVAFDAASESPKGIIYALCDPATGAPRYIGKTARSVKLRLQDHVLRARRGAMTHLSHWLCSIEYRPLLRIIEDGIQESDLNQKERFWIATFRKHGFLLTNGTPGGDGGPTFKGRKHSAESRARISRAAKGRDMTKAVAASSARRKAVPVQLTKETRLRLSQMNKGNQRGKGYKHTTEAKAKIAAASSARQSADIMRRVAIERGTNGRNQWR